MRKKKQKNGVKVVSKLAKKLVKRVKRKVAKKGLKSQKSVRNKYVIDLNVNVKVTK